MTVLLHFGMQKTGSTSLQRTFHRAGAWGNCLYLAWGGSQSNRIAAFRRECRNLREFRAGLDAAFGRDIRESSAEHVVISSEDLPFLDDSGFLALLEVLRATGRDLRTAGYVRKPVSFMESIFQERLKKRAMTVGDLPGLYPKYRRKFAKFHRAARQQGVPRQFWLFDPAHLRGGCIVEDFCHRTGLDMPPGPVVTDNVSLSLPAIRLLHVFRTFGGAAVEKSTRPDNGRQLVNGLTGLKGPKFRLHSRLTGPMLERHAADIAWMEQRLKQDLSEDIAAHDATAISDIDDLLRIGDPEITWLRDAGFADGDLTADAPPERIARAVARLASARPARA